MQVEEHQPQALARCRLRGVHRVLQHHAHGLVLAVGEQHGGLFNGRIDRINVAFDLKVG